MAFKPAPISTSFLVASLVGIIFSIFYIPQYSLSWAYAFGLVFICMLIASFISMTRATPDEQLLPRLRGKKIK
ncbi:hypothetical protein HY493_03870 [Candidatus Woesearchaeota archaeon]|nr:hypothetical protein [Candidatus Woesearchaeota archaeon]